VGCTSCPCDTCTFDKGWLCCPAASGPTCSAAFFCPGGLP
jgi:hypothetical protein